MTRSLTAALSLGAGLLLAGIGTPALAAASPDWTVNPPIPQAVLDSVHGGAGAKAVSDLDQTNPDGTTNSSVAAKKKVAGTTLGDPVRYVFLELTSGSTAQALTRDDFSVVQYAAVQYVDGVAANVLVVNENGDFTSLGWVFDDINDVVPVKPTEMIASGGPDGDLYEVSNDLKQVRPLNTVARDIVGDDAMPVEAFRVVKGRQMAARLAEYNKQYQAALDSGRIKPGEVLIGNPASRAEGDSQVGAHPGGRVAAPVAAAGAAVPLGVGYLLLRQVRRRRLTAAGQS